MYGRPSVALYLHTINSYAPSHLSRRLCAAKPIFFDDLRHLLRQVIVLRPLVLQDLEYFLLAVHVDDIHDDLFRLQEAMTAVNRLYEVVELVVNSEKNHAVTMPLEIAPAP